MKLLNYFISVIFLLMVLNVIFRPVNKFPPQYYINIASTIIDNSNLNQTDKDEIKINLDIANNIVEKNRIRSIFTDMFMFFTGIAGIFICIVLDRRIKKMTNK